MKIQGCLSHSSDEWKTPKKIYDHFMALGYFDPCPFGGKVDGLQIEWGGRNFVNPPYSQLKAWVLKSIEEAKKGNEVVLLIPARTDTKAFKALFDYGCDFAFVHKRLRFNDSNCAPFPSMLVTLNGKPNTIDLVDENGILEKF